jgi:CheY-like chemotaxis protein
LESSVFFTPLSTPAPALDLLSSAPSDASGLDLSSDDDPASFSRSLANLEAKLASECKRVRLLLVEDNPADVNLVREALAEHHVDCELLVINDGETAIRFVDRLDEEDARCVDLVVLDLNLPRRTGREVLERVRSSSTCGDVPVMILSSSGAARDIKETIQLGAHRYVRKPVALEDFMKIGGVIKELLSEARLELP